MVAAVDGASVVDGKVAVAQYAAAASSFRTYLKGTFTVEANMAIV